MNTRLWFTALLVANLSAPVVFSNDVGGASLSADPGVAFDTPDGDSSLVQQPVHPQAFSGERGIAIGDMNYPRVNHTSTMLGNGKVLITGWDSKVAELYNPSGETFSVTGSTVGMHREGSTATLLNNGKVLIVGGTNAATVAELYDPGTGMFSLTDSLNHVHCFHTATLLPDGRVLIAGGQDEAGPQTHAVCEIYDPLSGTFTMTDTLNEHRSAHTATLLPNGTVLIAGGLQTTTPGNAVFLGACEIYDPGAGMFTLTQSLSHARITHTATLLENGKALIAGGAWSVSTCELYDASSQMWTVTGPMMARRLDHTATLLPDGRVLLAGGYSATYTSSAEVYDPVSNSFSVVDSMTIVRSQHRASLLPSGAVLVTGGYTEAVATTSAELLVVPSPSVVAREEPPESFVLEQNYPNPFNASTVIRYQVPVASDVTIVVYDMLGRELSVLVNGRTEAGAHDVRFDGSHLASGVYPCRMQAGEFVQTRTLLLLR